MMTTYELENKRQALAAQSDAARLALTELEDTLHAAELSDFPTLAKRRREWLDLLDCYALVDNYLAGEMGLATQRNTAEVIAAGVLDRALRAKKPRAWQREIEAMK